MKWRQADDYVPVDPKNKQWRTTETLHPILWEVAKRYALSEDYSWSVEWLDETPREDGEWISVEDRLPDFEQRVLAIIPQKNGNYFDPFVTMYRGHNYWRYTKEDSTMDYSNQITHWMPLPSPPKK